MNLVIERAITDTPMDNIRWLIKNMSNIDRNEFREDSEDASQSVDLLKLHQIDRFGA